MQVDKDHIGKGARIRGKPGLTGQLTMHIPAALFEERTERAEERHIIVDQQDGIGHVQYSPRTREARSKKREPATPSCIPIPHSPFTHDTGLVHGRGTSRP